MKRNRKIKFKFKFQRLGQVLFKASVRYFSFYHQTRAHVKSCFCSWVIQMFVLPPSPIFFPVGHYFRGWPKIILKNYDVINCLNKNWITHFFDILKRKKHMIFRLCQLIEYQIRNIFMKKSCRKYAPKASPRPLLKTAIAYKKLF